MIKILYFFYIMLLFVVENYNQIADIQFFEKELPQPQTLFAWGL